MNTFGTRFRVTTFGESHGKAVGALIDGCPPGISLTGEDIQPILDRRRPGTSDLVTPRKESDNVEILSGVFEGKTTGTPLALLISNTSMRSSDYDKLKDIFRPGHADLTYLARYKIRDHRGGGRSSGRETAGRVAAGAVAIHILKKRNISISGKIIEIHGNLKPEEFDDEIRNAKDMGDSVGGIVLISIKGCPSGIGDPVFGKLDALIAYAMMSIGGVKGVEIGSGFSAARMYGSEHNDPILPDGFETNNAGGILGGISNGDEILIKIAVKPTPSIQKEQLTINKNHEPLHISITGRHDPCIAVRVVPVAEAMAGLVILDALMGADMYAPWHSF